MQFILPKLETDIIQLAAKQLYGPQKPSLTPNPISEDKWFPG